MIKTFRHSGLKRLYETASVAGVQPRHADLLRMLLEAFWRLKFEFSDGHVYVLDYEDYH